MITNTSTVDNNKIKMVVDKYKPYLCDIDFSESGTPMRELLNRKRYMRWLDRQEIEP